MNIYIFLVCFMLSSVGFSQFSREQTKALRMIYAAIEEASTLSGSTNNLEISAGTVIFDVGEAAFNAIKDAICTNTRLNRSVAGVEIDFQIREQKYNGQLMKYNSRPLSHNKNDYIKGLKIWVFSYGYNKDILFVEQMGSLDARVLRKPLEDFVKLKPTSAVPSLRFIETVAPPQEAADVSVIEEFSLPEPVRPEISSFNSISYAETDEILAKILSSMREGRCYVEPAFIQEGIFVRDDNLHLRKKIDNLLEINRVTLHHFSRIFLNLACMKILILTKL